MKKILLVEPQKGIRYHTPYPPLGLLKLAAYHKQKGDTVRLIQGFSKDGFTPATIYITSLFTYAYEPVHDVIRFYSNKYKRAKIVVGGIYASLCADHLRETFGNRIEIHTGLFKKAENILPDYSLIPNWKTSIVFSSRGCIRDCPFCSVRVLEPVFKARRSIRHFVYPGHEKVMFWDNNILASPYWEDIFDELEELNLYVDFNQGLDARLITLYTAQKLKKLRIPLLRLAYDSLGIRNSLKKTINIFIEAGYRGRDILVYCLYNYPAKQDTPESFLIRMKDLMDWGVAVYPMRYEPLEPRPKNTFVSPYWDADHLEMIARARRVIGYGGAFPPHEGLRKKIYKAKTFYYAFKLKPIK